MMHVTHHATERVRERVKVPKRAIHRRAQIAIRRGRDYTAFRGDFRKFLDSKLRQYGGCMYVHATHIYVVKNDHLITVMNIPKPYLKNLREG